MFKFLKDKLKSAISIFSKKVEDEGKVVEEPAPAEEKTEYQVILAACGDKKIEVIKEVRTVTGLGLKEAKDIADAAPKAVKEGASKAEADDMKAKLEAAGATVTLK